jgi:arylsulfatase
MRNVPFSAPRTDRPNVLLITSDQMRADVLGSYGNPVCRTPHLDALAASGVCFKHAYTPNPICVPARATITTGTYSHKATGSKNNGGLIRADQVKLAAHFAAAGYETYACGKLHYVPYAPPGRPRLLHGFQHCDLTESGRLVNQFDPLCRQRGLEDYIDYLADVGWGGYSRAHGVGNNDVRPCPSPLPAEHHVEHWVADRAITRLREHLRERRDRPFLIWASFPKPHSPYDPPIEYAHLYDPRTIPPPAGDESMLANRNPEIEYTRVTHAQDSLSPAARRVIKAYYYALVTFHDEQVGRVLAALDEAGVADRTIVVYTADHGDLLGDFGGYFKCTFLEGSARVPFLIRLPEKGDIPHFCEAPFGEDGVRPRRRDIKGSDPILPSGPLGAGNEECPSFPAGAVRRQLVGLQDILPTLAALTGCPLPQPVDGLDLTAALASDAAPTRDLFYGQCCDAPEQSAMVCDGRWKYCYAQWGATEELYDLAADPQELVNLAAGPQGVDLVRTWRARLIDEARRWGDLALFAPDGSLVCTPLDRAALTRLAVTGMGWRWF